jgi:uncharacterized membrane protein YccC
MIGVLRRAAAGGQAIGGALYRDLLDARLSGPRATTCFVTTASVAVATTLAMALHLDDIWWAAISGFMATQATTPASLRKGVLRIIGTIAGAGGVVLLSPLLVDDPLLVTLLMLVTSTFGILGLLVSPHGYAWMLAAVTVDMVLMTGLSDPYSMLEVAASRTAEVAVGTTAAMFVSLLAALDETEPPADSHPGWRHLLDAQWPATEHSIRAAIAVVTVPWVWAWLHVPSDAQIAVTITAVMALPALGTDPRADQEAILKRGAHRIIGCFLGGSVGLLCLAVSIEGFLPWMLVLCAGVWITAHIQASKLGTSYIGVQAGMVFVSTLVQGPSPPDSLVPGIERFAGIVGGLCILMAVNLLTMPTFSEAPPDADEAVQ